MALFLRKNMPVIAGLSGASLAVILMLLYHYTRDKIPEACFVLGAVVVMLFSVLGFLLGKNFVQLQKAAMLDDLTQLWNKKYFNIRLEEELERMKRKGTPLCHAYIDIDDFKRINDKYGHVKGDEVLISVAKLFRRNARNLDIVARWGGDEFIVIFPDTTARYGLKITGRLQKAVAESPDCYGATVSVGFVDVNPAWSVVEVLQEVDRLLWEAKKIKDAVVAVAEE